jgi:NADH-quinone oxidoreductase subunit E
MLTDVERREVDAKVAGSHDRRSASVGALRVIQAHRGYVPDEALVDLAGILDMNVGELEGVATFYSLIFRRPVGRKVLKVCDSLVCCELDGESLMKHLEGRLGVERGETTPDGKFTLLPVCCIGACDRAPAMLVNDTLVGSLTEDLIDKLLSGDLPDGAPSGDLPVEE